MEATTLTVVENERVDPLRRAAHEALSVGIGLGILGFQRFQIQRREWERSTGASFPSPADCEKRMTDAVNTVSTLFAKFGPR